MPKKSPTFTESPAGDLLPFDRAEAAAELKVWPASENTGWLVSQDGRVHVQVAAKSADGQSQFALAPWCNFDARVLGTVVEPDGTRSWLVDLVVRDRQHRVVFTHATLADSRKLTAELFKFGAGITQPDSAFPRIAPNTRFLFYLDNTSPGTAFAVDHLGWHDEAGIFVTPQHVIRPGKHAPGWEVGVVPATRIEAYSKGRWVYGFDGDWATAQDVLREVLTWQDPTVAAVFGAFWAACLLKGQTIRHTALFPICGIEGSSGSGKSNGFFPAMVELNGNAKGHLIPTLASMRNEVSVTRSGIIWLDDLTNPERFQELIRTATNEGDLSKSGNDLESNATFRLLAPLVLSGEGLALGNQQALRDRTVMLNPPPVGDRLSQKPGREGKPQWDDVLALHEEHGNLSRYAGWYVQRALELSDDYLRVLKNSRGLAAARVGDKLAILAAGAWLLDQLTENGTWAQDLVADWSSALAESTLANDNALTLEVLPWAIRRFGERKRGELAQTRFKERIIPPVLVERDDPGSLLPPTIYFNTGLLADEWEKEYGTRGENHTRLYSRDSLVLQAGPVSLGRKEPGGRVNRSFPDPTDADGRAKTSRTYSVLRPEYTDAVLARAEHVAGDGGEDQ